MNGVDEMARRNLVTEHDGTYGLASDDPRGVVSVIKLSKAFYRKMIQNLAWATGYNVFAILLAAGVLAWARITLAPAVGALLMSASTVVVALNAQLLRRIDLRGIEQKRFHWTEGGEAVPNRPNVVGVGGSLSERSTSLAALKVALTAADERGKPSLVPTATGHSSAVEARPERAAQGAQGSCK